MNGQFNLFEMMMGEAGFEAPIEPTPAAPAASEKKASKKASSKKVEDAKIALPCKVLASSWKEENFSIEGKTEATLDEINDALIESGYLELKMSQVNLTHEDDTVIVSLKTTVTSNSIPILWDENDSVVVCLGQYTMQANKVEFEGSPTMANLAAMWEEQYPQFAGVKILFDMGSHVGYPICGKEVNANETLEGVIKYNFGGSVAELEVTSTTAQDFASTITGGVKNVKLFENEGIYFPLIIREKVKSSKGATTTTKSAPVKKETLQEFNLPVRVVFTHAEDMFLSTEQFPGKEKITNKDLQQYLVNIYEEYTEDKAEFIYFAKDSVVEARIKSAKRG